METMNKLASNIQTITTAEKLYTRLQSKEKSNGTMSAIKQEGLSSRPAEKKVHIDLAAG